MRRPKLSDFKLMFLAMAVFAAVAVGFRRAFDAPFYLYNFGIIGVSISFGMGLWPLLGKDKEPWARRLSQMLVGGYLFFGLGCGLIYLGFGATQPENMQIEGFLFMVFAGVFQAAAIHYFVEEVAWTSLLRFGHRPCSRIEGQSRILQVRVSDRRVPEAGGDRLAGAYRPEKRPVHPLPEVRGQLPDGHRGDAVREGGKAGLVD